VKLQERGVPKRVTVQKVCRLARNEVDVRSSIDNLWSDPEKGEEILRQLGERNQDIFKFEEMLEGKRPEYEDDVDDIVETVTMPTA
jgi:hypothetical protein